MLQASGWNLTLHSLWKLGMASVIACFLGMTPHSAAQPTSHGPASGRPQPQGAMPIPSASRTYRIVFDLNTLGTGADGVNAGLKAVQALTKTYDFHGVSAGHRQFVMVLHAGATELALDDTAYTARHGGRGNPDALILSDLIAAGVEIFVSEESMSLRGLSKPQIMVGLRTGPTANLIFIDFESRGYVWSSTNSLLTE